MKLRNRIAAGALAVGALTVGFSTAGQVATTQDSADAATQSGCYRWNSTYISCWVDYNWYEESWWGGSHRDQRMLIYSPLIYKTW